MLLKTDNRISWLEFELLADIPGLTHGIFLRQGGHSQGDFGSLNLSQFVGDDPTHVEANEKLCADALKIDSKIARTWLYHGTDINEVKNETRFDDFKGDVFFTAEENLPLLMTHADCQVAIVFDPVKRILSLVHSGWRGSVKNVYAKTVRTLAQVYGCKPENLLFAIGPSLGPQSAQFINYRQELPEAFWDFQVKSDFFDFWEISDWQLRSLGVLPHHIQIARIDTYQDADNYFSFRRQKNTGRHATIATLLN